MHLRHLKQEGTTFNPIAPLTFRLLLKRNRFQGLSQEITLFANFETRRFGLVWFQVIAKSRVEEGERDGLPPQALSAQLLFQLSPGRGQR